MGSLRAGAEEIARARQGSRTASPCFADFGTGSGCIAVTLALELPGWQGVALDKSPAALEMARENAQRLGADHLEFLLADFARPPLPEKSLDLLVSNPPYVSEREYADLDREVRAFEPKSALVPALDGPDRAPGTLPGTKEASGLEDIKTVILQAERLLKIGGILLIEMGSGQGEAGQALFDRSRWERVEVRPDLAGLPRLLVAKKHSRTSIYKN
jgi:release factor glutamine methyltransferase